MKMRTKFLTAVFTGLLLCGNAFAVSIDNSERFDKDLKRDKTAKPVEVLKFSGVSKGMVVADILGGGGYYTELLSQVVGEKGKVYLHNNKAYMKFVEKELDKRLKNGRLANVVDYKREVSALNFKRNSLDAAFFVLGYHDMYHTSDDWSIDAKSFIEQIHKGLKPGGLLLIIDHSAPKGTGKKHAQKLHRIEESYVKDELEDFGFAFIKAGEMLRNPQDSRKISPFRPEIRRKTDRFVHLYKKK